MITSEDLAIEVKNVSKMYKKYRSNFSKILDLFGLSIFSRYEEFWPLRDINLSIRKGEKLGIIGRNGAGKTTLLSMISGNIKPTSGSITVNGEIKALFVLGTGFHPEFSGRENIRSSLAFQGITGCKAKELEHEIIEFSELDDFIDQPIKTYSAGMYSRLAFTVATAIKPEVLIIDEILGAGDAYFNAKALDRMDNLTNSGATVLFVSHDLSAVQKICNRCIWIDKGRIREDGSTLNVIKSYSRDVRRRDELRLLSQNSGTKLSNSDESIKQILFRFILSDGSAPINKGFAVDKLSIYIKDDLLCEINVGDSMDNDSDQDGYLLTNSKINWSKPIKQDDRWYREFKDLGGEFIHAAGIVQVPNGLDILNLNFEIIYLDDFEGTINFEIFDSKKNAYITVESLESKNTSAWLSLKNINLNNLPFHENIASSNNSQLNSASEDLVPDEESNDIYGSEEIIITKFSILNSNNEENFVFTIGDQIGFVFEYWTNQSIRKPVFVVCIYKENGEVVTQLIDKQRDFCLQETSKKGLVTFNIDKLYIGQGEYLISAAIFKDVDLTNPVEQKAYCIHDRKYRFKVIQPFGLNTDLGILIQDFNVEYKELV